MTEAPDQRPLVTFALFAYNQERFIREAVEGAFAQTYEPLEIILSDDFSTDRTFEIMQKMAAQYRGPHRVRVVKTPTNIGVIPHVLMRGREAEGEIVVVAAGDDVSLPGRTTKLVPSFTETADVMAAVSLVDIIDDHGATLEEKAIRPLHAPKPKIYLKTLPGINEVIQGCAAAYRREVFYLPCADLPLDFAEDLLFSFYINICGQKIARIDEALVKYRLHDQALSNHAPERKHHVLAETKSYRAALSTINMLESFRFLADLFNNVEMLQISELETCIKRAEVVITWPQKRTFERILSIGASAMRGDWELAKWKTARIYGGIESYQPCKFISFFAIPASGNCMNQAA